MTATVERRNPRRFRAFCNDHQDGYQGSKATAEKWASEHNAALHPTTENEWGAACSRVNCTWTTREEGHATRAEAMAALHKHLTTDHPKER